MACEIMLQRGKTRPNMLSARFETAADAIIAQNYTCRTGFPNPSSRASSNLDAPRHARRSHHCASLRIGHIAPISVTTAPEKPRIQPQT
jgi:hypothetical protein